MIRLAALSSVGRKSHTPIGKVEFWAPGGLYPGRHTNFAFQRQVLVLKTSFP
jgi:hypothetical protein